MGNFKLDINEITVQSLRKLKIFRVGTYKYRSNSNDGRREHISGLV